jgi:hypothetical protein
MQLSMSIVEGLTTAIDVVNCFLQSPDSGINSRASAGDSVYSIRHMRFAVVPIEV